LLTALADRETAGRQRGRRRTPTPEDAHCPAGVLQILKKMHWHLIHTKARLEKRALENLERQGYECYLPLFPMEKLCRGKLTVVHVPLFPRYLFIRLGVEDSDKSWGPIRSTRGVSALVRFGGQPARADDALIAFLKSRELTLAGAPARLFAPGDSVCLTEGPFAGMEGVYQMTDGEQRAMVLIELLGKSASLRVEVGKLRVSAPAAAPIPPA
jgi:transcriptional antiterminator RfaH